MKRYSRLFIALTVCVAAIQIFSGCRKERFNDDPNFQLEFSQDTILFDTVFSTVGSTTQYLRVRNNSNESIRISKISIQGPFANQYRINVDGLTGPEVYDMEILPNDSIFVFVEVTVDPNNDITPFLVDAEIAFETNGNSQSVALIAFGRNAYFHGGLNSCANPISEVIPTGASVTWTNDKPHVIYGIIAVDSGATLNIDPGTQVYCHSKSGIYVYKGTLNIQGSLNSEVIFQGDRLEDSYSDLPGQWGIQLDCPIATGVGPSVASIIRGGIWLYQSSNSTINYAILRNGNVGIQVDTSGVNASGSEFALTIRNTIIENMAGFGILGQGATIMGKNLLVTNCGQSCAYFGLGGHYEMDNCTFANYWTDGTRTAPAFVLNNYYEDVYQNIQLRPLVNCRFSNCIMFGNNAFNTDFNEFLIDLNDDIPSGYTFNYCLVDTDQNIENDGIHFLGLSNGQAPQFCDIDESNFFINGTGSLMSGNFANAQPAVDGLDLAGNPWSGVMWKGCYAYDASSPCE